MSFLVKVFIQVFRLSGILCYLKINAFIFFRCIYFIIYFSYY